jgi:hypothetical protein
MRSKNIPGPTSGPASKRKIRETFATKAAAQNWLIDNRKAVRDGKLRAGDNKLTVGAWLNTWLDEWAPRDASEDVIAHAASATARARRRNALCRVRAG